MGFYGNVSNTNKTAFSFDKVYQSRTAMDAECATDGVFIGRYVLVEYDEPPISAYYRHKDGLFYNVSTYLDNDLIRNPVPGTVYMDISQDHSANPFYIWDPDATPASGHRLLPGMDKGAYVGINEKYSPYTQAYYTDVIKYGRGYDSTAWRKTYDLETNKYRYVLISELNTVVPNFHLIAEAPSNIPTAPYFDRDTTTNIDYFLHAQAAWGSSIRNAQKSVKREIESVDATTGVITYKPVKDRISLRGFVLSDETVNRVTRHWSEPDAFGYQELDDQREENITGDIYYNKAGFNKELRSMTPTENTNDTTVITNTINYEIDHSGRRYYDTVRADGSMINGVTKPDVMEWYIHLPILGDAVCELWDTLYGYDKDVDPTNSHLSSTQKAHRYTSLAKNRGDAGGNGRYVTYDTSYAIGAINQMRDMMGYTIKDLAAEQPTIAEAVAANDVNVLANAVNALPYTFDTNNIKYLYYTLIPETNPQIVAKEHFYAYMYDPHFEEVTKDTVEVYKNGVLAPWYYLTDTEDPTTKKSFTDAEIYYLDDDNIFKRVNKSNYGIKRSDSDEVIRPYSKFYAPMPRWKLMELPRDKEDSLYGLITELHELLGNDNPDLRTFDTINGCINIIKDLVGNIDTQLEPHRLLMTNDHGQITHMRKYDGNEFGDSTEYPFFGSNDNQEILDCGGHWRRPVDYKLETFTIKDDEQKYFNEHYWGNSVYHELHSAINEKDKNCDTIGEAFTKVSQELSDIRYDIARPIIEFAADDYSAITGATIKWHCTYNPHVQYQRISYSINDGNKTVIDEHLNNQEYLTDETSRKYEPDNPITMGENDIVITLYILDERPTLDLNGNPIEKTQTITIKHLESYKYAITQATTNPTLETAQKLYNELKAEFILGANEYLYIQVPSANYRLFINNQYGGFDLFDANNHIYRTTNSSLGTIEVEIYE